MTPYSPPLRVVLVDHAPVIGGVEMMIQDLLSALDPQRISATVVTDVASPMRGRVHSPAAEAALPLPRLGYNPLALPRLLVSAARLARLTRTTQAGLIQTFTARTHAIGAFAGLMARTPVVWRLNDTTLPRPLARAIGFIPKRVVAVSRYLREHYRSAMPVTDLIPDGIAYPPAKHDTGEARRRLNLPDDAFVITLIARLVRWKGHGPFLRAMARIAPEYPDLHGLIVGGWSLVDNRPGPLAGGEPYYRELVALVDQLKLNARVTFAGQMEDPGAAIAASDIVAHTSTLPEPFGRVVVEAMAAGRPVIAARAGGIPEIVQDGVTGRLYPAGDVPALAGALRQLIDDSDLRERLGEAGRLRAERDYALPRMARRFTDLWAEVADA